MENDYSNLEHLVQDVTSLDTARMTLRWALERLSVLDHAARDLEKQLRDSRDRQSGAERRARELEEQVGSKMKLLSERETFYHKLEEMVSELSEGKIDLGAIAGKEAELEQQGKRLEQEYQEKARELERSQRELMAKWTERLRQAEAYEPQKLSETLQKYDEYRRHLEQTYQARLLALDQNFHQKESLLIQRENELEAMSSEKLQQARRLADMQKAWAWEREHLLEERKGLQDSLQEALAKSKEVEAALRSAGQKYREASLQWEAEREQLTRGKLEEIRRIQEENRANVEERDRQAESDSAARVEAAEKDYKARLLSAEQEWEEKTRMLEVRWEVRRKELSDETSRQEALLQEARAQAQELRGAMIRQKADLELQAAHGLEILEKAHQQVLERESRRYSEGIKGREETIVRLREQLQAARNGLVEAADGAQEALEAQRKELEARFEQKLKDHSSEEAARRDALAQTWRAERERLVQDVAGRDEQFNRAQTEIAELHQGLEESKKAVESGIQAGLLALHEEHEKRLQGLQQVWREEKQALLKQVERRGDVIQALRDHLKTVEDQVVRSSVHEQEALGAERAMLMGEFQKTLTAREHEETVRREALEKTWESERQRLQGEWTAALESLKRKDETIAQLQRALAEKAGLTQTRDEMLAQFESMKADLQDQHQKRIHAFESAVEEKQKTLDARWQAERKHLLEGIAAGEKKFDEAQAHIERLHEEMEWQKATERARMREAMVKEQEKKILALEKAAEDEKQALLRQLGQKDAAIEELQGRLNITDDRVTQAAVEAQTALEALRTKLTSEFQDALQKREIEEVSRRKVLEDNWQAERANLVLGFDQALKTRETEEASRRKASEESWYAERIRLLEEVSRRNDEFKRAQLDIRSLREAMDRQKTELEAGFAREKESLETAYKEALEQRMLRFRKEMAEREAPLQKLKEQLRLSENKLIESSVQSQEALESLRTKLTAEFEQALKSRSMEESARMRVLEEGWKRERQKLEQQLAERQIVVEELGERTRKAQDEAAASASRTAAQIESLRAQLIQDFEAKTRVRENDWAAKYGMMEENWKTDVKKLQDASEAERSRLAAALAEAQATVAEAQQGFEMRVRGLRAGWIQEKEDMAAKVQDEYDQKMVALLAACEDYRKELEARERMLRQKEENHEQGER